MGAVPALCLVGFTLTRSHSSAPALPEADRAAISAFMESPRVAAHGITAGQPRLVDSVTRGDDSMDIVRLDGQDGNGPLTIYFVVENNKVVDVTYAQNGSAP